MGYIYNEFLSCRISIREENGVGKVHVAPTSQGGAPYHQGKRNTRTVMSPFRLPGGISGPMPQSFHRPEKCLPHFSPRTSI